MLLLHSRRALTAPDRPLEHLTVVGGRTVFRASCSCGWRGERLPVRAIAEVEAAMHRAARAIRRSYVLRVVFP